MAYQSNIPLATDQLSQSQIDLQGNNIGVGAVLNGVDNLACLFPNLGAQPVTGNNIIGLFNQGNNLLWRNQNNGAVKSLTGAITPFPVSNSPSWTYLPSGMLIKTGFVSGVTGTNGGVRILYATYCPGAPAFTTGVYYVGTQIFSNAPADINAFVTVTNNPPSGSDITGFFVNVTQRTTTAPGTAGFFFIAIGV